MNSPNGPHTEPAVSGYTPDLSELFRAIERSKGRLRAVEYACFGLSRTTGAEAGCLVWVLDDVAADIDRIGETLNEYFPKPE